ncbi:MAG TPA: ATP-binding protein [Thermodesulfobacteriota bacterium]|nr:ATP-binding protein [Thermodesulfobacteriota bacterium]
MPADVMAYEEMKKKLDELTILFEMTRISTSSVSLDQMLKEMTKSLRNFLKVDALGIFLLDPHAKGLSLHPSSIGYMVEDSESFRIDSGKGIPGWVAEKEEALLVENVQEDSRSLGDREKGGSEICVPLRTGRKVIGVLDGRNRERNAFSKEGFHLFERIAEHLATIIENVRSEERYRAVVESALDGVMVMGENYGLSYINERLASLLGHPKEELIGRDFRDYLEERSREVLADRSRAMQEREEVFPPFTLQVLHGNDGIRDVEVSSTVIRDSEGKISTVAFLKDITEKRKMEERLLQAEKLRAVGEMANGIAHDFNNALSIIIGNTQLLLLDAESGEMKEALMTIEKVAKGSTQTVQRLLEFTRKGTYQELLKVDLNAVIRETVEMTKPRWKDEAEGRGIHIEMILNLEKIPPVLGTSSEMKEVITHVILNGIEAMVEGGRLEIRTFFREKRVYVQIADTGTGMKEEVKKKVFEPFFTTKQFTHKGLGLSMSYGIIKRSGGEIEVESKVGRGTTVRVALPAGVEEEGTPATGSS